SLTGSYESCSAESSRRRAMVSRSDTPGSRSLMLVMADLLVRCYRSSLLPTVTHTCSGAHPRAEHPALPREQGRVARQVGKSRCTFVHSIASIGRNRCTH